MANPFDTLLDSGIPVVGPAIAALLEPKETLRKWREKSWSEEDRKTIEQVSQMADAGDLDGLQRALLERPWAAKTWDKFGRTPLMIATEKGHADCVRMLIPLSNVHYADSFGETALMEASRLHPLDQTDKSAERQRIFEDLLAKSDPRALDFKGQNALMLAIRGGSDAMVKLLIPKSNIRQADRDGDTALTLAAVKGNAEWVKALIPKSDLQACGADALMEAVMHSLGEDESVAAGRVECVSALLAQPGGLGQAENVKTRAFMNALNLGNTRCAVPIWIAMSPAERGHVVHMANKSARYNPGVLAALTETRAEAAKLGNEADPSLDPQGMQKRRDFRNGSQPGASDGPAPNSPMGPRI